MTPDKSYHHPLSQDGSFPEKSKAYLDLEDFKENFKDDETNPRNKLIEFGPTALKDYELLANLLITGANGEHVLDLSRRILSEYGTKPILKIKTVQEIINTIDLPPVKACQILSALELGRRLFSPEYSDFPVIRQPTDAYQCFKHMESYRKETLEAVFLNAHNRVMYREVLTMGTVNKTLIDPAIVFEPAIACRAVGVIIAHNHPSGDWTPSEQDLKMTEQLLEAGRILGKPLLDHLIIARGGYHSILTRSDGCDFEA